MDLLMLMVELAVPDEQTEGSSDTRRTPTSHLGRCGTSHERCTYEREHLYY